MTDHDAARAPGAETIAVYGGSFDPPHVAHTLAIAYVLAAYLVDRVLVVPAKSHPFNKQLSAFEHRVRMCELALAGLVRASVSTIEADLPAPSLTLHTLEALAQRQPQAHLRLVIGSDLLAETHAWYNFARITEIAPPIVVQRQGHLQAGVSAPALPDVSSTEIRRRLRAGQSTQGLLSPAIADYALTHRLYDHA